jgi:excisionase family DNA binding protein
MIEHLLTPDETAERLGVRVNTIRTWARRGQIPVQRVGRCLRFSPTAVAQWLASHLRPVEPGTGVAAWAEPPSPTGDLCGRCNWPLLEPDQVAEVCSATGSRARFTRREQRRSHAETARHTPRNERRGGV